ncbi:MAG: hypothetical protein KAT58_12980 [candidate division Zixibacteria bacterium]|nr:hypothetical protein [candidate division Zixibacteria bacterium]
MSHYGVPDTTDGRFVDQFSGKYYYAYANSSVQRCPVCKGKGTVAPFFYSHMPNNNWTVTAPPQTCRSCKGKGYIIIK